MNTRAFRYSAFAPFFISLLATSSLQSQQLPSPWRATARDYSSTVFESVVSVPNNQFGTFTVQTNRYVEVGACLNYLDPDGRWTESQDIIELAPDGGAQSVQRPTKIHFNSNLNTPDAVTLVTPNNVVLTGHVLAIAYYDAGSGNAVVLSWAKDCAGEPLNSLDANGSPSAQDNSFSIQPARPIGGYPADGSTRTVFFAEVPDLGYNQVDSGHIRIWKISAPLNLPKLPTITQLNLNDGSSVRVALPVNTGGGQPSGGGAPQGNPAVLNLETVEGNRAINALWLPSSFGGTSGSIWFCTTAGGTEGKAFWFHANVSNYPNVTVTDGPFDGTAGKWNYYPTMGANVCGDICVVYTQSSSTTGAYPHIRYVWRKAYEPDGYFHPFQVLKTSGSAITDFESGAYVNPRWGDFGTVTVDPIDGTFWLSHAYVHSSGDKDWGTWWIPVTIQ
jgi:hypothetical protein